MRVRYSLALLVLGLRAGAPRGDAADSPAEGRASATEMYFRGGCRSLSRSATKLVWATSDSCEPIDQPDPRSSSPKTACPIHPAVRSVRLECNLIKLLHRKLIQRLHGDPTSTTQIIADESSRSEKRDRSAVTCDVLEQVGKSCPVGMDKNCEIEVGPTESPSIFVLEGATNPSGNWSVLETI